MDVVIWLGDSSYFVQIGGKRLLIDPVLSGYAAPLPFMVRAFDGTTVYTVDDLPDIDAVLISHDHYDHLDYATMKRLEPKTRMVIVGLGNGAHLQHWDYPPAKDPRKGLEQQRRGRTGPGSTCFAAHHVDVENGYLSKWDREWFHHFREGGYKFIHWVEIAIDTESPQLF